MTTPAKERMRKSRAHRRLGLRPHKELPPKALQLRFHEIADRALALKPIPKNPSRSFR
jgi:hypothetical protein